jgi:hypothetical protein
MPELKKILVIGISSILMVSCKDKLLSHVDREFVNAMVEGDNIVRMIQSYHFENGKLPDSSDWIRNNPGLSKMKNNWTYKVSDNKKMCSLSIEKPINGNYIYLDTSKRIKSSRHPVKIKMIEW